jgi:predicted AlkP superfamily pyrophosphatase or phosphodiesterase
MPHALRLSLSAASIALPASASGSTGAGPGAESAPVLASAQRDVALIVVIVVDQLRGDYLDRFGPQLRGGLAYLRDSSVLYTNARQAHALPETAPGHASVLSGRYPANTWIFSNSLGVGDQNAPILGAPRAPGASPQGFNGTTLVDWLRSTDSASRVLSISRKDRGAILTVGRTKGEVYWYVSGRFTTSTYYRDALPVWIDELNATLRPADWRGREWNLLNRADTYAERDSNAYEGAGWRGSTFPHRLPDDTTTVMQRLERWPWVDSITAAAALRGANALQLGRRQSIDLLSVSFSTLDAIGHDFGPDSREVHDHVLRLDAYLGAFLDSLGKLVPRARTVVVFTSDHGVNPFPAALRERGERGGSVELGDVARLVSQQLSTRYREQISVRVDNGAILADTDHMRRLRINVDSVARAVASMLAGRPGVARVYTPASLRAAGARDSNATLWKRQIPPGLGWLAALVAEPGYVFLASASQADHGTWHPLSAWVPIAFVVPGAAARRVDRPAETVDIAPTLAALLGLTPTEALDGRMMSEVVAHLSRR